MRAWILTATTALSLAGCVVQPAPYYGGAAPYYGTSATPGYVGIGVYGDGYYPYYANRHIRSNYNNDYWRYHHGHGFNAQSARGGGHAAGSHGGGGGHH